MTVMMKGTATKTKENHKRKKKNAEILHTMEPELVWVDRDELIASSSTHDDYAFNKSNINSDNLPIN